MSERYMSDLLRALLHSPLGAVALGFSRLLYPTDGNNWVDIDQVALHLPRLTPAFNGYRLAQISDFHIGTWINRSRLEYAIEVVNKQRPDLVAITGDFVTHNPEHFAADLEAALSKLEAPDGVVAVLGNHDHWTNPGVIRRVLRRSGVRDLSNDVFTLQRGGEQLHIAGVDDYMDDLARLDLVLEKLPSEGAAILLAHEPDYADVSAPSGRFDLQISGHTHGGQVRLPGIGSPILPSYGKKYVAGLYRVGEMYQYTNRGLGTADLQVRYNCSPEITLFTLHSHSSNGSHPDSF